MRRRAVPIASDLHSICWGRRFLSQSASRAFSNKIIESPSLTSVDIVDSWPSVSKQSDQSCIKEWPKNQTAKIIDGRAIADDIRSKIASEVSRMEELVGLVPSLAVILVGQRRDSLTYVRNKIIASEEVGIRFQMTSLPENCTEFEVCNALCRYNEDPSIHGILVQLPLPQHLDEAKVLSSISLEKDVDGFHPVNIGKLAMQGMEPLFIPCTPKGCIELLLQSGVEMRGKRAVVIGRSNIVGLPTSLLLQRHDASVTVVHEFTKRPEKIACEADILVAAAGVRDLVRGSWVKPGAVVVDVGTNPIEEEEECMSYGVGGDVCFEEAMRVASAITPVPGGVGPMTVAMLLCNTLDAAKRAFNLTCNPQ
ncbi:Amino acid dehydrogenase family protein [Perilla frutescens var. hirtella]|uniref:Amino acid dehydrogenase family protein n=1 Tax=Perilla frutescens var. hirtella TaxID=608512 RepID=A0AAD4JEJ1_PERFH|nr:Amino acid dehydrogenase family protein [Perilla frutescens var. hirtella]